MAMVETSPPQAAVDPVEFHDVFFFFFFNQHNVLSFTLKHKYGSNRIRTTCYYHA